MTTRRAWLAVGLALIGALVLIVACTQEAPRQIPPLPQPRVIEAGKTAVPGFVIRDANATEAVPPSRPTQDPLYTTDSRYPLIRLCNLVYLDEVWPSAGTANIVWSAYDQCITDARAITVTLPSGAVVSQSVGIIWPPQFIASGGGDGTSGDPWQTTYMPGWMSATTTFTTSAGYYNAVEYADATWLGYLVDGAVAAGLRYSNTADIAFVRINPGFEEENQPGDDRADEADFMTRHEAAVATCGQYTTFVDTLSEAVQTAFPNHEVMLPSGTVACAGATSEGFRKAIFEAWATATVRIGASIHSLVGDRADADEADGNVREDWRQLSTGRKMTEWGLPMLFEFGEDPDGGYVHEYGDDPWAYGYWAIVAGAGAGGDWIARNPNWNDYRTGADWAVADHWLDDDNRMWIVFTDRLRATFNYMAGYGASGYKGNYEKNGTHLTPTAQPQVCSQAVGSGINLRATVIARATTAYSGMTPIAPVPCAYGTPLPTPKATLQPTPGTDATADFNMMQRLNNYQGRMLDNSGEMAIAASTDWSRYGDTAAVTVTLEYLDIGTDWFEVNVATGVSSLNTVRVYKGNTQIWQKLEWAAGTAYVSNEIESGALQAFVTIKNDASGLEYFHQLYVDVATEAEPTATPTETFTPSPTFTSSPTPTPTFTASPTPTVTPSNTPAPTATGTITAVPTATRTRAPSATPTAGWTEQACPEHLVTVDGDLTGWPTIATPVVLDYTTASYAVPITTTTGTSGAFYCAWYGTTLYLAGVITDSTPYSGTGSISYGDAAQIGLDGLGDGPNRPRVDDHSLLIAPDGRVRDYEVYPISHTRAVSLTATGWQFELSISQTQLNRTLGTGGIVGLIWGILDSTDGAWWDVELVAEKRAGRLE